MTIKQGIILLLTAWLLGGCMAEQTREASWMERPRLGVRLKVMDDTRSLRVVRVYPGLPARRAGIQNGDTLLRLDGQTVHGMGDSTMIMDSKYPGDTLLVTLERAGRQLEIPVLLDIDGETGSDGEKDDRGN
jgi:S1-C subfamily serine protease